MNHMPYDVAFTGKIGEICWDSVLYSFPRLFFSLPQKKMGFNNGGIHISNDIKESELTLIKGFYSELITSI